MPDNKKPIGVSANAGPIDTVTAALRYAVVVFGAIPALLALLGARDFAGLVAYFQSQDGVAFVAAASALVAFLYGLWKTHRRGAQSATIAADRRVPDSVAFIK